MVLSGLREVIYTAVFPRELIHGRNGGRLVVIGADVHRLHAEALIDGQKFHLGKVLLFSLQLRQRPSRSPLR
jgi:hypothetical protein